MRRPHPIALRALFLAWTWLGLTALAAETPQPPSILYGELFDAVQRGNLYPDSKTFADAIAKAPAADILRAWRKDHGSASFDLKAFVDRWFDMPETPSTIYRSDPNQDVCRHVDDLWPVLTRQPDDEANSSLLPLPRRYVVPGGRYREIYYWDTYFTMQGLEASGRHDLTDDMLANFAYLIDTYGHIPNGNRSYYLSRSQPPYFASMVALVAKRRGDEVYGQYLPQMQKEYAFWMEGADKLPRGGAHRRVVKLGDGTVLNRYWDDRAAPRDESYREDIATAAESRRPRGEVYRHLRAAAESGWDFSSRWLTDGKTLATIHTSDFLPVDLNTLLYQLERAIGLGFAARGDEVNARRWAKIAEQRAEAIRRVFWSDARGIYTDYLFKERKLADTVTLAGLHPLYFGIATREQARRTASTVRLKLLRPEGVVPTAIVSGQQWDAPNGWPPLVWITVDGLRRNGEAELGDAIADRWIRENVNLYRRTGKLVEKYDVTGDEDAKGGEYPTQDGFGWTNGVLRRLLEARCEQRAAQGGSPSWRGNPSRISYQGAFDATKMWAVGFNDGASASVP
jgi:alpha,alpha-trehalase